ncbi:MAG: hypothetical protein R6V25_00620 [Desulfatiglandales bacterium]
MRPIDAYRQVIPINPEYVSAWHNLGLAYSYSGNRGAVLDLVKELRCLDPGLADRLFDVI